MCGLEIKITDTERREEKLFPNVITQSKPIETSETTLGKSGLRPCLAGKVSERKTW